MPSGDFIATADVFVACSSEFLNLSWRRTPREIITNALDGQVLENGCRLNVNVWDDWSARHTGMELFAALDLAAKTHEWAIVIFRADDLSRRVGELLEKGAVRDNVLFETGLFYGHLGSKRVFILEARGPGQEAKVASDLYGMLRLGFTSPESFADQMKRVLQTMQDRSTQWYPRWTPAASLAIGYVKQFIEPFVKKCVDKRQALRRNNAAVSEDFILEVLLPTDDFREMAVPEVRRMFEGSDCVQFGPEDSFDQRRAEQRPLAWAKDQISKEQTAASGAPGMPATYFDVPTTLLTAESVITTYLGQQATAKETRELFRNQANAFASYIEQQPKSLTNHVKVVRFASIGEVPEHLRG
jgi:Predicted nucleotide-binding protein containing TIR-like domain